jgi:hypothetical protein
MFSENAKIVPILIDETDIAGASDTQSIDMSGYSKATFISTFSTSAATTYTFNSGNATATKTTAVPFKYAVGGAAIGTAAAGSTVSCDVLGAWGSTAAGSGALTVTAKMAVCEVSASAMTAGEPWLTCTLTAASGIVHVVAILEPRYSKNRSATALA